VKRVQYDRIADRYLRVDPDPIHRYAVVPTVLEMAGDVAGRAAIDLACGSGMFCRLLKERGARRVVGIDISSRQIALARAENRERGIEYREMSADAADGKFGPEFDLATAVFLLHYSESEAKLRRMVGAIFRILKPGGRFAGIVQNPDLQFFEGVRYRRRFRRPGGGPVRDGEKVFLEIHGDKGKLCEFYYFHWSRKVYEAAFAAAGFPGLDWVPLRVDPAGNPGYGRDVLEPFEKNPNLIGLTAVKAPER